jgi:hypothetical protein
MTKFAKGWVLVLAVLMGCGIAIGQEASKVAKPLAGSYRPVT